MVKIEIHHRFVGFDRKPGRLEYVLIGLLLPFMFVVGGGGFALAGLIPIVEHRGSRNWQTTEAVVQSSEIAGQEVRISPPRHTGQGFRYTQQQHDSERPRIVYRYTVDGTEYFNNRYRHGDYIFLKPHEVAAFTSQYAAGRTVPVHYNPRNPQQSVLQRAYSKDAWFFVPIGGLFVVFGSMVGLIYFAVMRRFRNRPADPPDDPNTSDGARDAGAAGPSNDDLPAPVPWPGTSR